MAPSATDRQLQRLRAAVEKVAAQDAAELISDARREARQRAQKLLADAMTDAMLRSAEVQLEPNAERPRPAPASRTSASRGFGLYIYGVVPAETQLPSDLTGMEQARQPTLIVHGKVAAVVSSVSLDDFEEDRLRERLADMEWVERTARAHELALETIGRVATMIPMRMCSVYRDDGGVREMLEREATALEEALAYLEGKAEWGVKIFAGETEVTREPEPVQELKSEGKPQDAGEGREQTGTDYMRRRQDDREERYQASEQLTDAAGAVFERLRQIAIDAVSAPLQRPEVTGRQAEMLHNGVYLVEDQGLEQFLSTVHALEEEYRMRGLQLELTGPWPAYNFVPGTIGAAW